MRWIFSALLLALGFPLVGQAEEASRYLQNERDIPSSVTRQRSSPAPLTIYESRDFDLNFREMNTEAFRRDFRLFKKLDDSGDFKDVPLRSRDGREADFRTGVKFGDETYILADLLTGREFVVSSVSVEDGRRKIVFSALDRNQEFVGDLKREDIALFDGYGRQQCIGLDSIRNGGVPISVGVAIDISYSMSGYEDQINSAMRQFFAEMPLNASCSIVEFNHEHEFIADSRACNRVARRYSVSDASGGTVIFPALEELYKRINARSSDLALVLVISDGVSSELRLEEALAQKGEITTFVNWLGQYNEAYPLARFANAEIFGSVDEDGTLPYFFSRAGKVITSQYVVTECEKLEK